ncbi:MAG: putative dsRNA-binding protein, partial [Planctomycetes bacterium]|nr:putative dsRNA-binding protein [Planctomycetota bacterium]
YGFDKFIVLGKGLGARADLPRSILSNVYEAIIAALYIDGGYDVCVTFIRKCFQPDLRALVSQQASRNYKSALQQLTQSHMSATPTYTVLSESGPDHDKRFTVAAVIGKRKFAAAEGPSKKEAEQSAALLALKVLLEELDLGEKDSALLIELEDDEDDES